MSTFVLVHGGWQGAWCWNRLVPLLEEAGHRVLAPDLPGHGGDPTPLSARPWELYVPSIAGVLGALHEQAIVVGHSSGGMIISGAAEQAPHAVHALVYLAAFLLPAGTTPRDAMMMDTESILASSLEIDRERGVSVVKPECARAVFYLDCSDEDADWAIRRLQPEPLVPPGPGKEVILPAVPRFYVETLEDKALGPKTQQWMYTQSPCEAVYSLPSSHSPFLSMPQRLCECLLEIARR